MEKHQIDINNINDLQLANGQFSLITGSYCLGFVELANLPVVLESLKSSMTSSGCLILKETIQDPGDFENLYGTNGYYLRHRYKYEEYFKQAGFKFERQGIY